MKRPNTHRERDAANFGSFNYTKTGGTALWRDLYRLALGLQWRWFFAGLFAAELTINLIFACLYSLQPGSVTNARPGAFIDRFFFSVETLATVGYGVMSPATLYAHIVSTAEILVGMTFTAVATGLIFIRFSKPRPRILFADYAVIGQSDGMPTLTIRIANGHPSALTEARAYLLFLKVMRDERGAVLRRLIDLKLERTFLPFFPLTWNLIHRIDAESPLAGLTTTDLQTMQARLVVTLSAHDPAIAADIRAAKNYAYNTIRVGHRYQDAVTTDETGHITADLSRLSFIETE
jgi:inward rectifier potassium channel